MFIDGRVINGKNLASSISENLKEKSDFINNYLKRKVKLVIILANNSVESSIYVEKKKLLGEKLGIEVVIIKLESNYKIILNNINKLNNQEDVDGILIQLPLMLSEKEKTDLLNSINLEKDVDGLNDFNKGRLWSKGTYADFIPCTPLGIMQIIFNVIKPNELAGKKVVIIGRSDIVGKPLVAIFSRYNCGVSLIHSYISDIKSWCEDSDIVIVAVGKSNLLKAEHISSFKSILIDVGINKVNNEVVGDIDEGANLKAKYYTCVPGGVGPMTVSCLFFNVLKATVIRNKIYDKLTQVLMINNSLDALYKLWKTRI